MASKKYKKAVIGGVGLMGGSLALALKKKKIAKEIWGLGRNLSRLKAAKRKLKLSGVGTSVSEVCAGADLKSISAGGNIATAKVRGGGDGGSEGTRTHTRALTDTHPYSRTHCHARIIDTHVLIAVHFYNI